LILIVFKHLDLIFISVTML